MERVAFKKGSLFALFTTVFIDLIGLGIIIPILAGLFYLPHGPFFSEFSPQTKGILYGIIVAIYPFCQFIAAPILGDLSDRYGRKKLLIFSIVGTLIGYLVTAGGIATNNLIILLAGRVIDGFTGGNISIVHSAIADVSDSPEAKTKNFGLVGMAFGLGFIIGPFLGGVLSDATVVSWFTFATPFLFAALLSAINIILIIWRLPETLRSKIEKKLSILSGFYNIKKAFLLKNIRQMLLVTFLLWFGFSFFQQFFQIYLIERFHFTVADIGKLFGYIGLWIAIVQGIVVRPIAKRFDSRHVLLVSILGRAFILPILLLPDRALHLFFIFPFFALFQGLTQPNLTTTISELADAKTQGEMLGIQQSIQSLAQTIPPLIASLLISIDSTLPVLVAGFVTFFAWTAYLAFFQSHSKAILHRK